VGFPGILPRPHTHISFSRLIRLAAALTGSSGCKMLLLLHACLSFFRIFSSFGESGLIRCRCSFLSTPTHFPSWRNSARFRSGYIILLPSNNSALPGIMRQRIFLNSSPRHIGKPGFRALLPRRMQIPAGMPVVSQDIQLPLCPFAQGIWCNCLAISGYIMLIR
jgi:hypothetical protein